MDPAVNAEHTLLDRRIDRLVLDRQRKGPRQGSRGPRRFVRPSSNSFMVAGTCIKV